MSVRKESKPAGSMDLLRRYLKGSVHLFALSVVFSVLVSLLDMLGPRIISFTVDSVIGERAPDLPAPLLSFLARAGGVERLRAYPWMMAVIVAGAALAAALFRCLYRLLNQAGTETFVRRMREDLYDQTLRLTHGWHEKNSTGDLIQRCTSDVETIRVFVSEQLTVLVRVLVLIALAVYFMVSIDLLMAAAASVFIPVVIGYSLFFYARIGSAFEKADSEEGRLSAIAQENLTGVRVVRAFGREEFERTRFEEQNRTYTGFWIRLIRILTLNWVTGDVMTGLQYLLVTVTGTVFCIRGRITPGEMIAFVSYNAMLTWPVRSLGRVISEMSKAGISLERLCYIMNGETEPPGGSGDEAPLQSARRLHILENPPEITFEHVSFAYPGTDTEVLHDVSFTVPAGSTLGILGSTGSGKSTLAELLLRLYPLGEGGGRILVDGTDIREIPLPLLRGRIGMAQQEPFLFSGTLEENIRIGAPGSDEADLDRAAQTADLAETAARFPQGWRTYVGERGVTLSGGQKQRAAMAQMLIRRCPAMVFDDSLSAVDAETDRRIREALGKETAEATVILIAHRAATLSKADRIIVLEGGRITQAGTHEELLSEEGLYRKVWTLQTGAAEEGEEVRSGSA